MLFFSIFNFLFSAGGFHCPSQFEPPSSIAADLNKGDDVHFPRNRKRSCEQPRIIENI